MLRAAALMVIAIAVAACGGTAPTSGARVSAGAESSFGGPSATSSASAQGSPAGSAETAPPATPVTSPTAPPATLTPGSTATPAAHGTAVCVFPIGIPTNAGPTQVAIINDVRAAAHVSDGYDRIVFEFAGATYPTIAISVAHPPFAHDGSGQPFTVTGSRYLQIRLSLTTANGGYSGPKTIDVNGGKVQQLVQAGDFESVVTWIVGLRSDACVHLSTLTAPTRFVIDVVVP